MNFDSREYFLSAHAYCCEVGDSAVILDLSTGTYLGISGEDLPALRSHVHGLSHAHRNSDPPADRRLPTLVVELLRRGILTARPTAGRPRITTPTRALSIAGRSSKNRPLTTHAVRFTESLIYASRCRRSNGLASVVTFLKYRQTRIRSDSGPEMQADVEALTLSFLSLRLFFYTARQNCLFDSLALAVFLTQHRVACTFVIGVATKPFLAHSWVQFDSQVLNDTAERVQEFVPILAVGRD